MLGTARLLGFCGILLALLPGCTARYFHEAGAPPAAVRHELADWPYREYWSGVVFNGAKVGFSHFSLQPAADGRYEIRSEAAIVLHFLGLEKKINLKSYDLVNGDLALARFSYDYDMDGNRLKISGGVDGNRLEVSVAGGKQESAQSFDLAGKLYPSSAVGLYPALHGLAVGREYAYAIYDGETQKIAQVAQRVETYETSELFSGAAYRIHTELHGLHTSTWMDAQARPVFELGMNGALISALEDEQTAKKYLAFASLNKQDVLLDFSLVKSEPIAAPRNATSLQAALAGIGAAPPAGETQNCRAEGEEILCEMRRADIAAFAATAAPDEAAQKYLQSTLAVPARAPAIRNTARQIAEGHAAPLDRIGALLAWLQANIRKEAVDAFSALDVLENRKAECQGHAWLYAAFARSLGIPTRVVNGLVYSEELRGFLYHSWAESLVGGRWLPVDPTFGQISADATHIRLLEGESAAELLPLVDWVGKIRLRVISAESAPMPR